MQLQKEVRLGQVEHVLLVTVVELHIQALADLLVDLPFEHQQDGFFKSSDARVLLLVKALVHYQVVLVLADLLAIVLISHLPQKDDAEELAWRLRVVDYFSFLVVSCLELPQEDLFDKGMQSAEDLELREVLTQEVELVRGSLRCRFVADLRQLE